MSLYSIANAFTTFSVSVCIMQTPEDHELKPELMDVQISPTHQSFASPASPLTRVSQLDK